MMKYLSPLEQKSFIIIFSEQKICQIAVIPFNEFLLISFKDEKLPVVELMGPTQHSKPHERHTLMHQSSESDSSLLLKHFFVSLVTKYDEVRGGKKGKQERCNTTARTPPTLWVNNAAAKSSLHQKTTARGVES